MRSAKCATPRDMMQNSRGQVTVYHVNVFVSSDPGWRVLRAAELRNLFPMDLYTNHHSSTHSLCCFHSSTPRTALCPTLSPVPAFPTHASVLQPCSVPKCLPLPSDSRQYFQFPLCFPPPSYGLSTSAARILAVLVARPRRQDLVAVLSFSLGG